MTNSDFYTLLQEPKNISENLCVELKHIIETYPYFQPAKAVYLKALKEQDSFKYNHNLKVTAAYTTDRSVLFDYITSQEFNQNAISEYIKFNSQRLLDIPVSFEDISEETQASERLFSQQLEDAKDVIKPDLFEEKPDIESPLEDSIDIKEQSPEETLNIGKPLDFNATENHSFSEWLNLTKLQPIHRETDTSIETEKKVAKPSKKLKDTIAKKNKIIEAFISKNHKLEPKKHIENTTNLAKERMLQPEELMTETLARIYVEQKNYKSAIQSYKILSLKYPEKSGFFADQIKAVKQLQEKNNN